MPRCQLQIVKGITVKDMKTCVSSYISSLRYMKKIVPLTIYNIVYNRVNFNENLFKKNSVCNISFKTFKSGTKNHILADVFYWVKGVTDAIEKKQLKEMHLLFKSNTDNIIMEDYRFNFDYENEPCSENLPNAEDVINITKQLFLSIESLSEFEKMNADVGIIIEAVLTDESILETYNPPYFARPSGIPFFLQMSQKSQYQTIGYLKTGYHKMKCSVKGTPVALESRPSSVIDDINENLNEIASVIEDADEIRDEPLAKKAKHTESLDVANLSSIDDIDDLISIHSTLNDEVEDPDSLIDRNDVHCPCDINAVIGSTKIIKCENCNNYQHLVCVGCTKLLSLGSPYICVYCNSTENHCFDTYLLSHEQSNWQFICGFRLVLSYCFDHGKEPIHLLQRINKKTSKDILKLFKKKKIMKYNPHNGSCIINKEYLVHVMAKLFSDFCLPSTMNLDESTEDMEICE